MLILLFLAGLLALAVLLLAAAPPHARRWAVGATMVLAFAVGPARAEAFPLADVAGSVLSAVVVPVASIVGGIVLIAAGRALWRVVDRVLDIFERKTGIEVDAAHRAALHSALETGLNLAVQRSAPAVEAAIAAWVKRSVPGAIDHFGLSDEMLDGLVDAKVRQAAVAAPLALPGAILSGLADAAAPALVAVTR